LHRCAVGAEHDVWVEHREKCVELAVARGREERVHDLSLARPIGVGSRGRSLYPAARAAGELSCRCRGAPHDRSDVVEGSCEQVVQDEGDSLGRSQCFEYHEQGETDRV
jgi:hypothetical protein